MAGKSATVTGTDAFELFLDTACNAFGGIIFIMLLVCLMLQVCGNVAPPRPPEESARLQADLAKLLEEIRGLLRTREGQIQQIALLEKTADPERVKVYLVLAAEAQQLSGEHERLVLERDQILVALEKLGLGLEELLKRLKELEKERDRLKKEHEKATGQAAIRIRLPQFHQTLKKQVPLLLSGGRLAFLFQYDEAGRPIARNDTDVEVIEVVEGTKRKVFLRPRPGRGMAIASPGALETDLAAQLAKFTNRPTEENKKTPDQCHYFMVAVWADSYSQFEILRDLLIVKNFEYGLILKKQGEDVETGGEGGPQ